MNIRRNGHQNYALVNLRRRLTRIKEKCRWARYLTAMDAENTFPRDVIDRGTPAYSFAYDLADYESARREFVVSGAQ